MSCMVAVGDRFPSFRLTDHNGEEFLSSKLDERWFLLYWYPRADTPGCTAQALGLRDQIESFEDIGCVVLGASFDEPADNRAFREKYALPFDLLSDEDQQLAEQLGVIDEGTVGGYPRRIAHLVDASGNVRKRYDVEDPEFFAERVLDDLEAAIDL